MPRTVYFSGFDVLIADPHKELLQHESPDDAKAVQENQTQVRIDQMHPVEQQELRNQRCLRRNHIQGKHQEKHGVPAAETQLGESVSSQRANRYIE
ncbi:hypothetical protein D3C76_1555610 [compost metagenome]